jgi:ribose transport system ATP-binding protein
MNDSTLSPVVSARTSSQNPWLEVRDISKHFGGVNALNGVSLNIRRGFVHGLIGANGAGKSTLVRCLAGVVSPDSGEVLVDGHPVVIADPHLSTKK